MTKKWSMDHMLTWGCMTRLTMSETELKCVYHYQYPDQTAWVK
jgi:hypothetical protein